MDENVETIDKKNKMLKIYILSFFVILVLLYTFILSSPLGSKDNIIHVKEGESVSVLTNELLSKNVIRFKFPLKIFITLLSTKKGIKSGDYLIKKNSPIWVVAWQVSVGHHNVEPVKITIREGLTNQEIASLLSDKLSGFRKDLFLSGVVGKQGYLFPDTYYFYPLDTSDEIIDKLLNDFKSRTKNLDILKSNKSMLEILTMASILEGEAAGKDDVGVISGILWKRISLGMPLQVDIDKSTYTTKGLPTSPLNNPGLSTISAALKPIDSSYLYYLHDKNGKVHYASTYAEHRRNITNYLK